MKKIITILIVNFNSADFINLSLYSLKKLTKNPYKVFIVDNGSEINDFRKLKKYLKQYEDVYIDRWDTNLRGSVAHGTALNYLVNKVDTDFFSILDADATWLKKDWDEILINRMTDSKVVIGTQAPLAKPQDFPLMFAILFKTDVFKKMSIDFRPKDTKLHLDTGYEIREKYLSAGYVGENIKMKSTRNYKEGPFRKLIVIEFYLEGCDSIFASHFGRGSSLGRNKYAKGFGKYIYAIPYFGDYVIKKIGEREKRMWISIAKEIVERQI